MNDNLQLTVALFFGAMEAVLLILACWVRRRGDIRNAYAAALASLIPLAGWSLLLSATPAFTSGPILFATLMIGLIPTAICHQRILVIKNDWSAYEVDSGKERAHALAARSGGFLARDSLQAVNFPLDELPERVRLTKDDRLLPAPTRS
jgi:hypothetical protein